MKRRMKWILGVGCLSAIALMAISRWLTWRNRYVSEAEIPAQAARDYEKENASYLAAMRGPPRRLSEVEAKYQEAAKAVAMYLVAQKEDPNQFRVSVWEEDTGAKLVFSLAHIDDYLPENRGAIGNPSGKDRRIEYDPRSAKVTSDGIYQ